uniref:Transposase n=1 Tax=Acidithiobacillus ferrianus TaxID=2678518 RepID=A0A845U416_9PROT|nr:transposase [Acidithiobacillus ferrianus]
MNRHGPQIAAIFCKEIAMTHTTLFVGIDVAKAKFDVALLNAEGKYHSKVFPNTPPGYLQLLEWLTKHDALGAHLCMETTGVYGRDLAHFLVQQQLLVSVVNPAQVHAFGRTELNRAKTDKADARLIARYCQMHRPAPWAPPAEEIATLQALVQRLEDLLGLQTMENSRLEAAAGPARESVEAVLHFVQNRLRWSVCRSISTSINTPISKAKRSGYPASRVLVTTPLPPCWPSSAPWNGSTLSSRWSPMLASIPAFASLANGQERAPLPRREIFCCAKRSIFQRW